MKRCVPYVIKHEGLNRKAATGKCSGMYDSWKKKQSKNSDLQESGVMDEKYKKGKYYEFRFDAVVGNGDTTEFSCAEFAEKATSEKGYNMVVAIGNRFMKGVYVSTKEMKAAHKAFNNTLHDLNHMGSGYVAGFSVVPSDISYIVGWQDGLSYNDATDEVRANVHVEKTAVRYDDWKSYIDISAKIGRNPNVSMFVYGNVDFIEARKLPKNSRYSANGYKADDLVPCMVNIQPFMVSTVTQGECDNKKGCGIKQSCEDGNCNISVEDDSEIKSVDSEKIKKSIEENKQKMKYFNDRIKRLKGER